MLQVALTKETLEMNLYNNQKSITDFMSTVDSLENYFSIDAFFPNDEKCKLVTICIDAIELAKYLYPNKKMWIDIETIFVTCYLNDIIEILPNLQINELIESEEINNLSIKNCTILLTQLKQRKKYYEISLTDVDKYLEIHSLESHKDWKNAIDDVKFDIKHLSGELEKRAIWKIVVNFYDTNDSLSKIYIKNYLSELDFFKYNDVKYEYNVLREANKYIVESLIYFYPNYIGL